MRYRLASNVGFERRPALVPASLNRPPVPVRRLPVESEPLAPVLPPSDPSPRPIPIDKSDPALPPLSREDRDPPGLKEIPVVVTTMSPVFIPPLREVAIEAPPAPVLKDVPVAAVEFEPMSAMPLAEAAMDAPEFAAEPEPPLRAVATISPVLATLAPMAMEEAAISVDAPSVPPTMAVASVAMEPISVAPMTMEEVALDTPPQADAELAMLWPSDRIDDMRNRVMPYYDPEPFMPVPAAIKPEPAEGIVSPLAFLGRMVRSVVSLLF
jgi:hypothetical protein